MSELDALRARVEELEQRLAESERTHEATLKGQIDAVSLAPAAPPVLLRDAQEALRRREQELRAIFNHVLDGILIADDEGRFVDANPAACAILGRSREELLGLGVADIGEPGFDFNAAWEAFTRAGQKRGTFTALRPGGERRQLEFNAKAYILPGRHLAVIRDVTDLNAAEAALRRSENRVRHNLSSNAMGVYVWRSDGRLLQANDALLHLVGRTREELEQGRLYRDELLSPDARPQEQQALAELRRRGTCQPYEVEYRRPDDSRAPVLVSAVSLEEEDEEEEGIAVVLDLSQQRRIEDELRETTALLEALIAASPEAIILLDLEGRVTLWNPAAERTFGWSAEEVRGRIPPIAPTEEILARLEPVRRGESIAGLHAQRQRKDGALVQVSLSQAPLRSSSGELVGALTIATDITKQRQLQEQLAHSGKMEAIGRLAGGIAHDFNNALAAIVGFAGVLAQDMEEEDPRQEDLAEIMRAAEQGAAMTRQLLAMSRQQVVQAAVIEPNSVIRDLERMLTRLIGEDIEVVTSLAPDTSWVQTDAGQLEQVLMNLVVNARDAMPDGGSLTIETACVDLDESYTRQYVDVKPGRYVRIAVSDTGRGMDKVTQARIFEPFFTTKAPGKGTGLGLATLYGIVKQNGGHVSVYSELDHGTTFKIYLPATEVAPAAPAPAPLRPRRSGGGETILVVEDEALVRRPVCMLLEHQGYKVLEAKDGAEAVAVCAAHAGPLHLVVSDVVMPKLGGRALATELATLRPELKIIYMSGYTENAFLPRGGLAPGTILLQKPFTADVLLSAVRDVLDGGR